MWHLHQPSHVLVDELDWLDGTISSSRISQVLFFKPGRNWKYKKAANMSINLILPIDCNRTEWSNMSGRGSERLRGITNEIGSFVLLWF